MGYRKSEMIDMLTASIIVVDKDSGNSKEIVIKNMFTSQDILNSTMVGDIFNIKGLGRLKVIDIREYDDYDDFLIIKDFVFMCKWVSDWWDEDITVRVDSLIKEWSDELDAVSNRYEDEEAWENYAG